MLAINIGTAMHPAPARAELILTGPHAGYVWYSLDGVTDPLARTAPRFGVEPLTTARITGGDPPDLRKAAAILRAQSWWLGADSSMRARADADRLDALAAGTLDSGREG
jgi:hypothetical protein